MSTTDIIIIINLFLLECLLSVDNAAVLAVMVKVLPENQRAQALKYGIFGAYAARIACLVFVQFLTQLVWLKIAGGAYLMYLTYKHFFMEEKESTREAKSYFGLNLFWSTVVSVELADIAFSIDNVFAAVAMSDKMWVIILGVVIGITAMRFVAQWFMGLIEKYPSLNTSAYIVIGILGLKLVVSGIVDYIPFATTLRHILEDHYTDLAVSGLTLIIFFFPLVFGKKSDKGDIIVQ